jgi:hypothetical protein
MEQIDIERKNLTISEKLYAIRMTSSDRAEAFAALYAAERMVDFVTAIYGGVQRLTARMFLRPRNGILSKV